MSDPVPYGFDPGNPIPETVMAWLDDGHPRAGSDSYRTVVIGGQREVVEFLKPPPFRRGTPMHATLDRSGPANATVLDWQEVHHHDIGLGDIPAHWVSRQGRSAALQIERLVAGIEDLAIADLARAVLTCPTVAMRFFRAPASRAHHHAYPGGLADHCAETATLADRFLISGSADALYERDLTIAGALLHDVGKCLPGTGYEAHERRGLALIHSVARLLPDQGCTQHSDLLEVLEPRKNTAAAESAVRRAIRHADQASAGLQAEALAFGDQHSRGTATLHTHNGDVVYRRYADRVRLPA
ncbi:HD domain-containing protein [bacterium]|nr:HD domain-containing protein [bacterium]